MCGATGAPITGQCFPPCLKSKIRLEAENAPTSIGGLAASVEGPRSSHERRPLVLRSALSLGSVDPSGFHDYSTRNAGTLASGRLSPLLALAIASTGRTTADRGGIACADPADEQGEFALGSATYSRRTAQAKYMVKRRGPPSQGWQTFLRDHAPDIAAMDLFVVPTIGFKLLYGFVIIRLDRRDVVWINVTANPTADWIARQITEAFPWKEAPRSMIRDQDRIYGTVVTRRLRAMAIRDKPIAPASPWQNGFAERLIGIEARVFGSRHRFGRGTTSMRAQVGIWEPLDRAKQPIIHLKLN
jgi:hypothetical protein